MQIEDPYSPNVEVNKINYNQVNSNYCPSTLDNLQHPHIIYSIHKTTLPRHITIIGY
jgi:hypothetical protein